MPKDWTSSVWASVARTCLLPRKPSTHSVRQHNALTCTDTNRPSASRNYVRPWLTGTSDSMAWDSTQRQRYSHSSAPRKASCTSHWHWSIRVTMFSSPIRAIRPIRRSTGYSAATSSPTTYTKTKVGNLTSTNWRRWT